jgi:hypothetical protein
MAKDIPARRAGALVLGTLAALWAAACIRLVPPPVERPPAVLERLILCATVTPRDGWAEPSTGKAVFRKGEDANVFSFLAFKDLVGEHALVWKWFGPAGALYRATDPIAVGAAGRAFDTYIAWDRIYVSDDKADGKWTAAVFLDGALLAVKTFEIK